MKKPKSRRLVNIQMVIFVPMILVLGLTFILNKGNLSAAGDVLTISAKHIVKVPGDLLRAEAQEDDLYKSIDFVKDDLTRQLRKYKSRHQDLQRRGGKSLKKRLSLSRLVWRKDDINDKNL